MGGLVDGSTVKGDLWMVEAGSGNLACYQIPTHSEGPGPRVGHASLLAFNAFIVFGGDTKIDDQDMLDDTLYLLNTCASERPSSPVTLPADILQLHGNGREHCPRDPGPPGDTATRSTSSAPKYSCSEGKWRAISSTTSSLST